MFGCVYLPNFICQATFRLQPNLRNQAIAIFEGTAPLIRIVAVSAKARKAGIFIGMTKTEAEGHHEVVLRERVPDLEISAHAALLDCGQKFSPRIEDIRPDTAILDLSGLHNLIGTPTEIAHSIRDHMRTVSLHARVGVASSIDVALFAARTTRDILVVPDGEESRTMQDFTLDLLELEKSTAENFRRWGVHRFGQLAALPTPALIERLGQRGLQLQRLVRGESMRVLSPTIAPQAFVEAMDLDHAVREIESLAFVFRVMLDQLCARLASHALATAELEITLILDLSQEDAVATNQIFIRSIKLPVPTADGSLLLKLAQLDLATHPPGAAVQKIKLEAYSVQPQHVQEGMFVPQGPEPQQLQITLARLFRIVGEDRVGSPEIIEQHTTNTYRLTRFSPWPNVTVKSTRQAKTSALRAYRPPRPAGVRIERGAPTLIQFENCRYRVQSAAGPWRRSGQWWTQHRWGRDEWDLVLINEDGGRLIVKAFRNLLSGEWFIEGQYD